MNQLGFELRNDGYWYAPPIDPSDVMDYTLSFKQLLNGDTIQANEVDWVATDITVLSANNHNDATSATVWLCNGVNRKTASVTCTVRTTGGRTIERSFRIEVKPL